ncbi:phosphatidylserine decarboxylase family protein [Flavivirga algicola]|uniref:Phosphatidylserine decarboxylase n=1 Tax=Flavivirga algicola TaxID=2729136 RepID=A0ABX1S469_9FLAO|nr:phosphatidylserine decarboxylase family protein [Flavivirga algicola]NMH89559.1 phosphatidylserine decarboxylase [Flavivirga algicola]
MKTSDLVKLDNPKHFEQTSLQYQRRFGVIAGYLPKDIIHIGKWLSDLVEHSYKEKETAGANYTLAPSILEMKAMLTHNKELESQVNKMIEEGLLIHKKYEPDVKYGIKSLDDLFVAMNYILHNAPKFQPEVSHSAFPMSGLFVYMMATPSGWIVFKNQAFNDSLRNILQAWCDFLDSPETLSVVTTQPDGWLSPASVIANNLNEFVTEETKIKDPVHWGFKSFNDYFHRQIILLCRPLDGPDNDAVIVSANDGTIYRVARNVKLSDNFETKSQNYSLKNMLGGSPYTDMFKGGDVLQTFLSGHDYHRWRAPITGEIVEARVINGYMFSELPVEGWDPTAGTYSQGYEANVNTRGLIIIKHDDPKIGLVAVMPIGITEISSIKIEVGVGDHVKKGEELGTFSYGGSSLCLIFQKGAIKQFTVVNPAPDVNSNNGPYVRVRAQVAIANTSSKINTHLTT